MILIKILKVLWRKNLQVKIKFNTKFNIKKATNLPKNSADLLLFKIYRNVNLHDFKYSSKAAISRALRNLIWFFWLAVR